MFSQSVVPLITSCGLPPNPLSRQGRWARRLRLGKVKRVPPRPPNIGARAGLGHEPRSSDSGVLSTLPQV